MNPLLVLGSEPEQLVARYTFYLQEALLSCFSALASRHFFGFFFSWVVIRIRLNRFQCWCVCVCVCVASRGSSKKGRTVGHPEQPGLLSCVPPTRQPWSWKQQSLDLQPWADVSQKNSPQLPSAEGLFCPSSPPTADPSEPMDEEFRSRFSQCPDQCDRELPGYRWFNQVNQLCPRSCHH